MAVFVVLSDEPNKQLYDKIKEVYPNDHFALSDRSWLVSADAISRVVSGSLGITTEDDTVPQGAMGMAVVFTINGYYGFHNQDTWEWISLKL